jgi:hypothetical protein
MEVVERAHGVERPLSDRDVTVFVGFTGGDRRQFQTTLDHEGQADLTVVPEAGVIRGPVRVRLRAAGIDEVIADDAVSLTREAWARSAGHRGGWVTSQTDHGLTLRAAPARGTFARHYTDAVIVEVLNAGQPCAGVALHASSEDSDASPADSVTNEQGRTRIEVRPRGGVVSLTLTAHSTSGMEERLQATFPVASGAFHVAIDHSAMLRESLRDAPSWACAECGLIIESSSRKRAYVTLVDGRQRIGGAPVAFSEGRGNASWSSRASVNAGPLWVVVSDRDDHGSSELVGWPVVTRWDPEPADTFDVPDALLLDTLPAAVHREEKRVSGVRVVTTLLGLVFIASVLWWVCRSSSGPQPFFRKNRRTLPNHFGDGVSARAWAPARGRVRR